MRLTLRDGSEIEDKFVEVQDEGIILKRNRRLKERYTLPQGRILPTSAPLRDLTCR